MRRPPGEPQRRRGCVRRVLRRPGSRRTGKWGGAWAPSGNRKLNRNILGVIEGQQLTVAGEFDPSPAVREINRALQTAKRSRSTLNWDEISRALCGLYTTLPVCSAYIDAELDLAKAITDKNKLALRNPCDLLTSAHAVTIPHELSRFETSTDLRNTQRARALERFSERSSAGTGGLREERGDLSLGHVNHVAGGKPPGGSDYDNCAASGAGPGYPDGYVSISDDYSDPSFAPSVVCATQGLGKQPCWNPGCSRVHNGTAWCALCGDCWTFRLGSCSCGRCNMVPGPLAPKCANWSQECLGVASDFGPPMADTFTPGSSAYIEGRRVGALGYERKHGTSPGAAELPGSGGRFGGQHASGEDRMAIYEPGMPARDSGREVRWAATGPSGKGGHGKSGRHRGGGAGYGRQGGGQDRGEAGN